MFFIFFTTDLFSVFTKKKSITTKYKKRDIIKYDILVPSVLFLIQYLAFSRVKISGYKRTFVIIENIWIAMNVIKIIFTFHRGQFMADLIRLVDSVWIIYLFLLILTDPETNTPKKKNQIIFYEVYFRYLEYHILILSYQLIWNYKNIDIETKQKLYTTSAVVGKKDSLRVFVILLYAHYYFPIVNGIAYSIKYWISFFSLLPMFYCIDSFKKEQFCKVYFYFYIILIINLLTYIIALFLSAPNVGNGEIIEKNTS